MLSQHPAHRLQRPTPAIVSQEAVWRLPRWILWSLCLLYILAGFVLRDPWKNADIIALGFMQSLAEGRSSWLNPSMLHHAAPAFTWLPYWLGALSIHISPALIPLDMAARLPFVLLLLLTFAAVWYSTYLLTRTPHAQPLPFALGGEAQATDYARAVADGSLLALMATLGLAQLGHEATATLTRLAFVALWLLATAATQAQRTRLAFWAGASASLGLAFSGGAGLLLLLAGLWGISLWLQDPDSREPSSTPPAAHVFSLKNMVGKILLIAVAAALASVALQIHRSGWALTLHIWWADVQPRQWDSIARLLAWFVWPTGLLALVALWHWRAWWRSPHILLPAGMAALTLSAVFIKNQHDRALLLATPALAVLAAMYLPTMRRSIAAWIDWFTLLFFSFCALCIWVIWFSLQTGWPAQPAHNVQRLLPGLVYEGHWWATLSAAIVSLIWLRLIAWRVGRDRSALWKSLALPAGGAVFCWVLLLSLWFPLLNYARSYQGMMRHLSTQVAREAPEDHARQCAFVYGLPAEQVAALYFYRPLPIVPYLAPKKNAQDRRSTPARQSADCAWFLLPPEQAGQFPDLVGEELWVLRADIHRSSEHEESLLLYRRDTHY